MTGTVVGVVIPAAKGYLLVTWRAEEPSGDIPAALDAVIALSSPQPTPRRSHAAVAGTPRARVGRLLEGPIGRAVAFAIGRRSTPHLRHHCPCHDFSRWIAAVFRDEPLADAPAAIEARLANVSAAAIVEEVSLALIAALHARQVW